MATVRTRKRGKTYSYNFDVGIHPETGRRRVLERGGFATQQEAYNAGVAAFTNWKTGNIGITSERITLLDYITSWLENVARPNVSIYTYGDYLSCFRSRVHPYLGNIILQDLRPRDIDAWVHKLAARGLSRSTIRKTKVILSHALCYAVYPAELIAANPCSGIQVPRSAPAAVTPRVVISSDMIAEIFKRYPEGSKYHIPLMIAYHTGARISEILGLTWDHVDLTVGTVSITQQINYGKVHHGFFFAPPKTAAGQRIIYLDGKLITALQKWKVSQSRNALYMGGAYQCVYELTNHKVYTAPKIDPPPTGAIVRSLVCTDDYGLPIHYSAIRYALRFFGLNAHSFRHTHATKLIEAGAKPIDVAARLGHADAATTQNLYTHDTVEMQKETAAIFSHIVGA